MAATEEKASAEPEFGKATIADCEREQIHIPGSIQPYAALLAIRDSIIVHSSANITSALGLSGEARVEGMTLEGVLPASVSAELQDLAVGTGSRRLIRRVAIPDVGLVDVMRVAGEEGIEFVHFESVEGSVDATASFQDSVTDAVIRMQAASTPSAVVEQACSIVRDLTGFDRVMGYRFEPDHHGVVIAEERREDLEPFLGLHYPASDIPAQARALYLAHWLRLIPDVAYEPVPVQPVLTPGSGAPLDMSALDSRSVSPIHCQYLTNMGVKASMSISLVVDGRLWGLIACHHYSAARRPSAPTREACEFVALTASVMLGAQLSQERTARNLRTEGILARIAEELLLSEDLAAGLAADEAGLSALLEADGVVVAIGGQLTHLGDTPSDDDVRQISEQLSRSHSGEIVMTDSVGRLWPELKLDAPVIAGLTALPLSSLQRNYILWFRRNWSHDVVWGGEPDKAIQKMADGTERLAPRASFDAWVETVEGRSRPWDDADHAAVEGMQKLIANHITRSVEQLARLNAELARSNAELDAFAYVAAHDLKEPLRGMANYATFLNEDYGDVLDQEGRDQLETMIRLASRMTHLLGSLLEYAKIGRSELRRRDVLLSHVVVETEDLLRSRLAENNASVVQADDLTIYADPDLIGQVLMNLLSNGIKYNDRDAPTITVGVTSVRKTLKGASTVRSSVLLDSDTPVIYVQDDGIGIPEERLNEVFRVFRRLHGPDEYGGGSGAGLTIARRIIERHGGAIWVESTPGTGSTFYFTLEQARG